MKPVKYILLIPLMVYGWLPGIAGITPGVSCYQGKPGDPEAVYFTPENFGIRTDGKTDISELLQKAINTLKLEQNIGIIFIPEETYIISKTIFIPERPSTIAFGGADHQSLFVTGRTAFYRINTVNL